MVVVLGLVPIVLQAAAVPAPPVDEVKEAGEMASVFRFAVGEFRQRLKDAESARFQRVRFMTTIGYDGKYHHTLCGEVNAKNSFGAYGGWDMFYATEDHLSVDGGRDNMASMICDGKGEVHELPELTRFLARDVNAP